MRSDDAIEYQEGQSQALVVRERSALLTPVMDVTTAVKRLEEFQGFCAHYLQESKDGGNDGGDFGAIPGAGKKKILLKSGADKLCEIYGLYDEYEFVSTVENWEKNLFDYTIKCILRSRRDDSMVGTGLGSCSSYESKYRYRDAQKRCPVCGQTTIIKGKAEYDGGWLCWAKKGGCGAKFADGDQKIESQKTGRIQNEDVADLKNTILKMAKKRAKIDGVISVTRSSGIFTQDMEDIPMLELPKAEAPKAEETSKKNARKKKAKPTQEQLPDPDYIPDQPDDNGLSPQPTPQPANGSQQRQTLPVTLPVISEGRVRRFYAIVSAKGWTKAQAKDIVNQVCAPLVIESADQIPVKFYDQICAALEKGRKHA